MKSLIIAALTVLGFTTPVLANEYTDAMTVYYERAEYEANYENNTNINMFEGFECIPKVMPDSSIKDCGIVRVNVTAMYTLMGVRSQHEAAVGMAKNWNRLTGYMRPVELEVYNDYEGTLFTLDTKGL